MRDVGVLKGTVTTCSWKAICEQTAQTFRFTQEELRAFEKNQIARLISEIPFAAGCEDAHRTSLAHLAVYITELRGGSKAGAHSPKDNDSVYTRLRLLSSFKGGNASVIEHGMSLLALVMLNGYKRSCKKDLENNGYNPLNDSWDYNTLKTQLIKKIEQTPNAELDKILTVHMADTASWDGV